MISLQRIVALICLVIGAFSSVAAIAQSQGILAQNLGSGPYTIKSLSNSSVCVDLSGANPTNGTAVQSLSCNGTVAQTWSLAPISTASGTAYQVVASVSGSCVDVSGASQADGAPLLEWPCLGANHSNQLWQMFAFGTSYELVSVNSGKCIDLAAVNSSSATQLQQWTCSGGTDTGQLWNLGVIPPTNTGVPTSPPAPTTGATVDLSTGEQAFQADAFVDSIGINTHITYQDTPYWSAWPTIFTSLEALGVHHIRDGFYSWPVGSAFYTEHQALAKAGIKTDYVFSIDNSTTPLVVQTFANIVQDMESIEAPNECDAGQNCGGGGLAGINNVAAFMNTMSAVGSSLNLPILGPSFTTDAGYAKAGQLGTKMTYNNMHIYFGGRNPGSTGWGGGDAEGNNYGSFAWWMDQAHVDAPSAPIMITETGYMAYTQTNTPYTLPESIEASYVPRTFALAFNHGIKRTYIYELLDEVSSPGYGLLRSDLSPKPAYSAMKNLISLLSDPGTTFTPSKLTYVVSGADESLSHTLLQKRDGSFWLALWLEQSSYNPATNTSTPVASQQVTISISGGLGVKQILQMDNTGAANSITGTGSTVSLPLNDQMALIQIGK
ncbi:RICIN domain-containing protein [Granulicella tundricola]|uniref:Ricin B lectin n=1 Tax=Granulicella tundricola (strain ATCC BAA-1859 / DSM 23138 / MP5ACTX9) TaxID=1198114 RepID=E8X7Q3_GRATM|nr:RICIN domain-containing protein [Granulicella tundricola]ADW71487.1 Ricin B lectin [Granulicella tundricola MP5ACTX9]